MGRRRSRQVEHNRASAAQVQIGRVERGPVGRRPVGGHGRERQRGRKLNDRLAAGPVGDAEGVAGRRVDVAAVGGDPARSPDASAPGGRGPGLNVAGVGDRDGDDPPAVVAAVAPQPSERHVEDAVDQGERGALALDAGRERRRSAGDRAGHVDRPPRSHRAVVDREREDLVRLGRARRRAWSSLRRTASGRRDRSPACR